VIHAGVAARTSWPARAWKVVGRAAPRDGTVSGGSTERAPVMLRDMLGTNIKLVSGFQGTANVRQAIDSGEEVGVQVTLTWR
jgi:hypothetical protein